MNSGLLPRHYLRKYPKKLIEAYVGDYIREEIAAETITRNIPAFCRFLEVASLSNGKLINFRNFASECGVSAPTVKEYFQILEDTLLANMLPAYRKRAKRRLIGSPKFYFFDVGVSAYLARRGNIVPGSELFGKALEHIIYMEIKANSSYSELHYPFSYWRTASGFEVDFILGDYETAPEVKATSTVTNRHLKGIRAFKQNYLAKIYFASRRNHCFFLFAEPKCSIYG